MGGMGGEDGAEEEEEEEEDEGLEFEAAMEYIVGKAMLGMGSLGQVSFAGVELLGFRSDGPQLFASPLHCLYTCGSEVCSVAGAVPGCFCGSAMTMT